MQPARNETMGDDEAIYFRDTLREARSAALRNSEGFSAILYAIERLGRFLNPSGIGLGHYRDHIAEIVRRGALSQARRSPAGRLHVPFDALYSQLREARNAALHEGAFARHLTSHSIEMALLIEDGLMSEMDRVGDFMVRGPVCASAWHPLSFVRQTMLANSFSFLPIRADFGGSGQWRLVSDRGLARYLRSVNSKLRSRRLAESVEIAVRSGGLELEKPYVCAPDSSITEALERCGGLPVLIRGDEEQELIGIASPYDLL